MKYLRSLAATFMPVFRPVVKRVPAALLNLPTILALSIALLLTACGGGSGSGGSTPPPPSSAKEWTWVSGSSTVDAIGVYGTLGVAAASNVPGARSDSVSWTDSSGNFWLFGGGGGGPPWGSFNDLWEFNPAAKAWTWMSGSNAQNAVGFYGTQGTPSAGNVPGARDLAVSWLDSSGNLWLFGGGGFDSTGAEAELNDLWKFNPTTKQWTWVSGSSTVDAIGVYGTQGVAAASNVPGARYGAVSWLDSSSNFWLFGGLGDDSTGPGVWLNDLWEFNPTTEQWTWVSGGSTGNAQGVYGTLGVTAASNVPGARNVGVSWLDSSGNLWLFGGNGYDSTGTFGNLNDLWEFNLAAKTWTWVSGSSTANAQGIYGTQGTASASNVPGARDIAVSWTDSSGNFWLLGGEGFDSTGTDDPLNDLWEFNPTTKQWTWVSGSNTANAKGVYGTQGVATASNVPGARSGAVSWIDSSGNLWLFGGEGFDSTGTYRYLNDLWRYQP